MAVLFQVDEMKQELIREGKAQPDEFHIPTEDKDENKHSKRYGFIQKLSSKSLTKKIKSFFVADIECILNEKDEHVPVSIGILRCRPNTALNDLDIVTRFYEDQFLLESLADRSTSIFSSFMNYLESQVRSDRSCSVVYFHNFSQYDGILLTKHLVGYHSQYKLKPLMRNGVLYELKVFFSKKQCFIFRDSYRLLPQSLKSLARDLCPELGDKGEIDFNLLTREHVKEHKSELIRYMKQDILLLGGIMLKAQEILSSAFSVDIVNKITISALALTIFRTNFFDPTSTPIHIPSHNIDQFIRRGYYGGHADVYMPKGENLHYYDVNSLYPYVMQTCPMPIGKPKWHSNLLTMQLDHIYGFVEADVVCPETMKRPFLPYLGKDGTLIFPGGRFFGVDFSEELKYARYLGYKVEPLRGYLYKKKEGMFTSYVESLASRRSKAKQDGHKGMSFV